MREHLPGGRPRQLVLRLPEVQLPRACALRDHERPLARPWRIYPWARAMLEPGQRDDPRVCPPQVPGQLALFSEPPRRFRSEHGARIRDREVPELDLVLNQLRLIAQERGVTSAGWFYTTWQGARLALASREPGERLVRGERITDLPQMRPTIEQALRRAHLLQPARPRLVAKSAFTRGSCAHCLAWNGVVRAVCAGCHHWERKPELFPVRPCKRCGRVLPTSADCCRRCRLVVAETACDLSGARLHGGDQLWFGGGFAPLLRTVKQASPVRGARGRFKDKARAARAAARRADEVSAHLLDPAQPGLFPCPDRDWTRLDERFLPMLTGEAQEVVAGFAVHLRALGVAPKQVAASFRTLRIVVGHLGVQMPLRERDIRAVASLSDSHHHARLPLYLQQRALWEADSRDSAERQRARDLADALPGAFATPVHAWIRVMVGEGSRPSRPLKDHSIYNYVRQVHPVLSDWARAGVADPRAVTSSDIAQAVAQRSGANARATHCALRSLFRALRRERLIFRDPARTVSLPSPEQLPRPLPSDRLRGLLDGIATVRDRLIVALVAVHALMPHDIRHLLMSDIDPSKGRITVRRLGQTARTVYLEEITWQALRAWLGERAHRWPRTANPYLLVTRQTAVDDRGAPVAELVTKKPFMALGLKSTSLRGDRILDEAQHTADPIHLIRVFGIAPTTAMKYLRAAHPARFPPDPIAP
ncbi:hypothetical protein [Streptomyces sp. NRRL S-1824]|uniref:hypothetical protein n=1 Tax=Streptomyces sp. NRRL S-1824 TaxID=1463889 RepID=UPI00131BB7F9|nr:hypothetical protein [Streptomyces sp. NRRL S-1824]